MVSHSPVAIDGKIITLIPWQRGFRASDFDTRFHISQHQVTPQFPCLAAKLRPIVGDLGADFGWVMQDIFADVVAATGVP